MYKAGQILLVKFHPSYRAELRKYRPALVISGLPEQIDSRYTLVVPLTTKKTSLHQPLEVELMEASFLKQKSYALLWQPQTIDVGRVQRVLGALPPKELKNLQKRVREMFA